MVVPLRGGVAGKRGSLLLPIRPLGRLLTMFIDLQITALVAQKRPDEGAEFAGDRDDDLVARKAPCGQPHEAGVEPVLCLPAQGKHLRGLSALAVREFFTDLGRCRVMLGTFDEDPPRMGVARFGDTLPGDVCRCWSIHWEPAQDKP